MTEEPSDPTPDEPDVIPDWLRPGSVICSRFEVREHLGTGSVGRAFRAADRLVDEVVVIKVGKRPATEEGLVRDEYRALRGMRSSALPTPIGYFEHRAEDATWPVLVVDLVDGQSLERWADGKSARDRIRALAELASALGILSTSPGGRHGDLWQPNVMVSSNGRVRLIDPDGDSLGRSAKVRGAVVRDGGAFCLMARALIAAPDERIVDPILNQLESAADAPNFTGAAMSLRACLMNPLLSELEGRVQDVAPALKADRTGRRALYRRILDAREVAFRALIERFETTLTPFECSVVDQGPAVVDLYKTEIAGAGNPKGSLWQRHRQFIAPDGEELNVGLESTSEFKKPWPVPEQPGLVSRGYVSIVADHKSVAMDLLQFWLQEDMPRFLVFEGNRWIPFDQARLDRAAKILVGATLPAISSPWHGQAKIVPYPLSFYGQLESYASAHGLEHSLDLLPRTWLHFTLSQRLRSDRRPGSEVGSELPAFFDVPEGSRLTLVQAVGARVIKNMPGDLLESIYRLDVTPIDHANRTLRVVVEARSRNETEHGPWTFDLTFPKMPES